MYGECRPGNIPPGAWWNSYDPNIFFPSRYDQESKDRAAWSCFACQVKDLCATRAKERNEQHGIWAGEDVSASDEENEVA